MKRLIRAALPVLAFVVATSARAASDGKLKIAVLDIQARGVDAELAKSAGPLVANELNKLEVFKVISKEDIRNMLSFEKDKQSVGCEADQACLAEIGGALGVEYIVAGSLAKIGDSFVIALALNNVKQATVENRVSETVTGKPDALIAALARNAKVLVSKLLKGREGYLVLSVAESGAIVKIDGQIRGTTPVKGRMTLSWGPHLLEVEKTGFVSYSEDISVPNKQALAKNIALVPSNDFINGYESSAKKMRTGAWIATGLAVAGGATAVIFNQLSSSTETKFANARTTYSTTLAQSDYDSMRSLSSKGSSQVTLARIGLAAGVVGLAAATYFWVAGDDPHRYEGFKDSGEPAAKSASAGQVSFGATPLAGGGQVGLAGSF
jgi:TolB-like protein